MLFLPEQRKAHLLSRIAQYGELTTKSQFGGVSLMIDDVMFAITSDSEFYLKGSGFLETLYKATKMSSYHIALLPYNGFVMGKSAKIRSIY